jgi:MFS family permease
MFFASGFLALLPSLAREVSRSPMGYGILLGCFGFGALLGAVAMQRVRARWSAEIVVSGGTLIFGLMTIATGGVHAPPLLGAVMLVGGDAWIVFISLFNVLILNHTPDWVRARVLAVSMLVFQGAVAAGSAAWGALAARTSIRFALVLAGVGTMTSALTGLFLNLPDSTADLTPWTHWRMPTILERDSAADDGPIMVTVEYYIDTEQVPEFLKAIDRYSRMRRRDGAYRWGNFRDMENATATWRYSSWTPGRNTFASMSARARRIVQRSSEYKAMPVESRLYTILCTRQGTTQTLKQTATRHYRDYKRRQNTI